MLQYQYLSDGGGVYYNPLHAMTCHDIESLLSNGVNFSQGVSKKSTKCKALKTSGSQYIVAHPIILHPENFENSPQKALRSPFKIRCLHPTPTTEAPKAESPEPPRTPKGTRFFHLSKPKPSMYPRYRALGALVPYI